MDVLGVRMGSHPHYSWGCWRGIQHAELPLPSQNSRWVQDDACEEAIKPRSQHAPLILRGRLLRRGRLSGKRTIQNDKDASALCLLAASRGSSRGGTWVRRAHVHPWFLYSASPAGSGIGFALSQHRAIYVLKFSFGCAACAWYS